MLADAFTGLVEKIGVSASQVFEALLHTPIPSKYKKLVRQSSKAGLAQMLRSQPEPSKDQLKEALTRIRVLEQMPQLMRPLMRKAAKELPHARSGPRNKLTSQQEIIACAQITSLRSEYTDREAIQQTATKYKVSERTMYRIWRKYRSKKTSKVST